MDNLHGMFLPAPDEKTGRSQNIKPVVMAVSPILFILFFFDIFPSPLSNGIGRGTGDAKLNQKPSSSVRRACPYETSAYHFLTYPG